MKRIIYQKYGKPEVLEVEDTAIAEPAPNEVRVKIMAAGINPIDYKLRNGSLRFLAKGSFPRVIGGEIAGVIDKTGEAVQAFRPGQKVFAMLPMSGGGYAEYLCVNENLPALYPEVLEFTHAASIPLAGLTALQALRDKGNIQKGMEVLINGGSGGVGMFAIQIAKAMEARVTAVCSGKNIDFVRRFGADHVIDYEQENFTRMKTSFDIVFDAVAKSSFTRCKSILKPAGVYISTVPAPGLMLRQIINPLTSRKAFGIMCKPGSTDLYELAALIAAGKLKTNLDKVYPLEQAPEAHRYMETGRVKGKLVLTMNHQS